MYLVFVHILEKSLTIDGLLMKEVYGILENIN